MMIMVVVMKLWSNNFKMPQPAESAVLNASPPSLSVAWWPGGRPECKVMNGWKQVESITQLPQLKGHYVVFREKKIKQK